MMIDKAHPTSWEAYKGLAERCQHAWKKQKRISNKKAARRDRKVFHDPEAQAYYAHTRKSAQLRHILAGLSFSANSERVIEKERQLMTASRDFFSHCARFAATQFAGYQDAPVLDYLVPHSTQVTHAFVDRGRFSSRIVFEHVIISDEVRGQSIDSILKDRRFSEAKKAIIRQEGLTRGIAVGFAVNNPDQANPTNIIVADLEQEVPQNYYHIDFEYVSPDFDPAALSLTLQIALKTYEINADQINRKAVVIRLDRMRNRIIDNPALSIERRNALLQQTDFGIGVLTGQVQAVSVSPHYSCEYV